MVDMCREKKTGMAEECRQSDGKWECCELVLNAVFYWEPVEFFQNWCDMITLRFFQDEPCGVVLDLLYAHNLFIGYSCKSSIALVQSWRDHKHNKLFCGTVREERMDRGDSPECKKHSAAEATDVLFHWQCLVKMHSKVRNGGLKRNATSTYICRLKPTELIRTDEPTSIISVFSVLSFSLCLLFNLLTYCALSCLCCCHSLSNQTS